jgi:hypothetical protein
MKARTGPAASLEHSWSATWIAFSQFDVLGRSERFNRVANCVTGGTAWARRSTALEERYGQAYLLPSEFCSHGSPPRHNPVLRRPGCRRY